MITYWQSIEERNLHYYRGLLKKKSPTHITRSILDPKKMESTALKSPLTVTNLNTMGIWQPTLPQQKPSKHTGIMPSPPNMQSTAPAISQTCTYVAASMNLDMPASPSTKSRPILLRTTTSNRWFTIATYMHTSTKHGMA